MFDAFFDFMAGALAFFYELSGESYGGAIILLTLAINLALLPLTLKGTRSMMQMQRLQPEMKALQQKYKDDKETLNRELMAFYKENSINPVGGCLPLLLQMPVFIVLYQVVQGLTRRNNESWFDIPKNFLPKYLEEDAALYQSLIDHNTMDWLGIDLSQSAQRVFSADGVITAFPYLVLIAVVLVTSYVQQKQVSSRNPDAQTNSQQKMLLRIMPAFFALISWSLPAALTLYFATANLFRVAQQELISRTMYRQQREAAKEGKAAQRAGDGAKGKADAIEAKSSAGPVGAASGGLLDRLLGRDDESTGANGSSNGSASNGKGSVSEGKGRPTPKRNEASGSSKPKPKPKPKSKSTKGKATAGRTTPSGSLPQPRPRKKKRK